MNFLTNSLRLFKKSFGFIRVTLNELEHSLQKCLMETILTDCNISHIYKMQLSRFINKTYEAVSTGVR